MTKKKQTRKRQKRKTSLPANVYGDSTVREVMVAGYWFPVKPGTWRVDLRGPYLHATWKDRIAGTRYSAFISKCQMVEHGNK